MSHHKRASVAEASNALYVRLYGRLLILAQSEPDLTACKDTDDTALIARMSEALATARPAAPSASQTFKSAATVDNVSDSEDEEPADGDADGASGGQEGEGEAPGREGIEGGEDGDGRGVKGEGSVGVGN